MLSTPKLTRKKEEISNAVDSRTDPISGVGHKKIGQFRQSPISFGARRVSAIPPALFIVYEDFGAI